VTVFSSIENGIYYTISISAAILIFRMLKAKGCFLEHAKVHSVVGDHIIGDDTKTGAFRENAASDMTRSVQLRSIYIPIDHNNGSNPDIEVRSPYDGILIYRFSEGFNYPNANHYLDHLMNHPIHDELILIHTPN
jgi:solute carrier family 26 (sodium-independent sulfate anion transporter), member 11